MVLSKKKMTILILGANGATGRLLVDQLLKHGQSVKIIVRTVKNLPENFKNHENVSIICASVLDLSDTEIAQYVKDCDGLASCLGHNMSFKGIFGRPRRLVTDATRRFCSAIKASKPIKQVKFVLMNTAGNSNRDISERISHGQKFVIWLLRLFLPPHVDNEKATDFLRLELGQNDSLIEWVAVRPDNLVDEREPTEYEICASPTRSAIFDAGTSSRINVAHFMATLITDDEAWIRWKGQMPVIYNKTQL